MIRPSRRAFLGASAAFAIGACRRPRIEPAAGPARRVVSLSPSTTEAMCAIGACGALVGRSRYCDFPPEIERLPQVGGYVDPNVEAILALTPDLVTGARGPAGARYADVLEGRGVHVYAPRTESLAEIHEMIHGLGERTGHADDARRVSEALARDVATVEERARASTRRTVLLVFGLRPIVVGGPGCFVDEMLSRAGGVNVVTEGGAYPTLGFERVLALDPHVVLDLAAVGSAGTERILAGDPVWKKLRAVREGRLRAVRDAAVLRPGPRVAQGMRSLFDAVHGAG